MGNSIQIHKIFYRIDVYRIHDWFYYVGFVILGNLIKGRIEDIQWQPLLISSLALAFIYALNDFSDYERKHIFFIFPLIFLIAWRNFITLKQWIVLSIFLLLQISYCVKPLRLKRIPIIGSLCCALTFPQFFLLGYMVTSELDSDALSIFLFLFLLSGVIQLLHEVNDIKEDALSRIKTSAVFLGKRKIEKICISLLIVSICFSLFVYLSKTINLFTLIALVSFQLYILIKVVALGITYKTRMEFRILSCLSGTVWLIFLIL